VLTDWIVAQASRIAPSPFSDETQDLMRKYAPPQPERARQFRELALVVGHSVALLSAVAVWGLVGWLVLGGHRPSDEFVQIGWGLIVVFLAGLALHLIRYYDALVQVRRAASAEITVGRARRPTLTSSCRSPWASRRLSLEHLDEGLTS
jgi:hypothetical protein